MVCRFLSSNIVTMRLRCSLLILLCLLRFIANAQFHPSLEANYRNTYYYRISNDQALQLFKGNATPDNSFYKEFVYEQAYLSDSLPLSIGNYLKISLHNEHLNYEYIPITPWRVYILDKGNGLMLQLKDIRTQQSIAVTEVKIDNKQIAFDPKTESYILSNGKAGVLTIKDYKCNFYYAITQSRANYSGFKRFMARRPFRYFATLLGVYNQGLVDGYYSVKDERPIGAIKWVQEDARDLARVFRPKAKPRHRSYFYFNKPQYRQGDSIKFKAHFLNDKTGIWYDKPLLFFLGERYSSDPDLIFLGTVYSKNKGAGYNFQFSIQDSMDIDLDDDYQILAKDLDSNIIGNGTFTYENYELKKAVFEIDVKDKEEQVKGKPFYIHVTAKDDNGLPMPDTRISITINTRSVYNIGPDHLFIPTTLWQYDTRVRNGTDSIIIPDSIFPAANLRYELNVVMKNSENEYTDESAYITYKVHPDNLILELLTDSIKIDQPERKAGKIHLYAKDRFSLKLFDTIVTAPCLLPLNTNAMIYYADCDYEDIELNMEEQNSEVRTYSTRTIDSTHIFLSNPRQLTVVYHLYKNKKEIRSGTTKDFPLKFRSDEKSDYHLSAEYVWAGKAEQTRNTPLFFKGDTKLEITQPAVITPGKETEIGITATDYENRPVEGLNLLAYSYTDKFRDAAIPNLPALGIKYKTRSTGNSFRFEQEDEIKETPLDYPFWNETMMLDTNWAYRFRYPSSKAIEFTVMPGSDSITQLAPFVMKNGSVQSVHYVFIDNVPIYFGFTDYKTPYSFEVDTNYHEIKIRTSKKLITLDSIKVKAGYKTLFSIDQEHASPRIKTEEYPDTFTLAERKKLSKYVMKLEMNTEDMRYAYLEAERCINLSTITGKQNYNMYKTVGPITTRYWRFSSYQRFDRNFQFEPNYTFTLAADLVKMKSNTVAELLPAKLDYNIPELQDEVMTRNQIQREFNSRMLAERKTRSMNSLNSQIKGKAILKIDLSYTSLEKEPINIILGKPNDFNFLKVYAGNVREINDIPPGQYQLLLIDEYNLYRQTGIIEVKEQGTNFYRIKNADTLKGSNVKTINTLLNRLYCSPEDRQETDISLLMTEYTRATYNGISAMLSGTVVDENGEGLPGASIQLAGTKIGTITDVDGRFKIDVPGSSAATSLNIVALGYEKKQVLAWKNMRIQLSHSDNVLTEVMVMVPYGPPVHKEKYVGAADVITSQQIEKMPVADFKKVLAGEAPGIQITNGQPGSASLLTIRGYGPTGNENLPLIVINGVPYNGNLTSLDPMLIMTINVLKDEATKSLYGARAANGIIAITTRDGAVLPEQIRVGLQEMQPVMSDEMMISSLRNNFKDDAYWQPDLVTDKNGKASFKVKFPDDITNWKTMVFGTDDKNHTGSAQGNIKAYKPVTASLYLPHFLLDGDSAVLIGKSVNYISDTIAATTSFYQNSILNKEKKIKLGQYQNDTLPVTALGHDSLTLKYVLTKEDGFFDGEEHSIPLKRVGAKTVEGSFLALDMKDTSFSVVPAAGADTLHFSATASIEDIVLDEIEMVRDYGYLCNEQMASKIIALLTKEKIYKAQEKSFDRKDKEYIRDLISKLTKNRNSNSLWGWWENGVTTPWISAHVTEALLKAREQGYYFSEQPTTWADAYIFNMERDTISINIPELKLLMLSKQKLNFGKYIGRMEQNKKLTLNDYFELVRLRQQLHLPYKLDRLKQMMQTDIFGNIYWKDTAVYAYNNEVLTTLNAYKILENDSSSGINKNKVANWLLQQRGSRGWRNTFESVQIIEALVHSLPLNNKQAMTPALQLDGGVNLQVNNFPFRMNLPANTATTIRKTGATPVYFSWYYEKWDTTNNKLGNNFKLRSWFESNGKPVSYLPAGQPVTMKVTVDVDKSAEYILVEIPIPAGCSYQNKEQSYYNHEIHREYFNDKVSIFCEKLTKGSYQFEVSLLPRYAGNYTLNPARAELMYFPVFYGREKIRKVSIRD